MGTEAIGKRPRDICIGEFGQVPTEQNEEVLRTGKPLQEHLETQLSCKRKEPVWCLTTKLQTSNQRGQVVGLVGFSRDVRVPVQADEIPKRFCTRVEGI